MKKPVGKWSSIRYAAKEAKLSFWTVAAILAFHVTGEAVNGVWPRVFSTLEKVRVWVGTALTGILFWGAVLVVYIAIGILVLNPIKRATKAYRDHQDK